MKISFSRIGKIVTDNYYILVMLVSFAFMFHINLYIGALVTAVTALHGIKVSTVKSSFPIFKSLIIVFFLFNLLTCIQYSFNGLPIYIYISEIQMQLLPIIFFFIGNNSRNTDNNFYKSTLIASIFMFLVGIYLYFTMPQWYINWKIEGLSDWLGNADITFVIAQSGLSSFFYTPYYTGYFSVISLAIIMSLFFKNGSKLIYIILFFITFLVMILAQMRVAWLVGFFILFISMLYGISIRKKVAYYLLFLSMVLMYFIIYFISENKEYSIIVDLLFSRFDSINSAIAERASTWNIDIKNIFDLFIGHGLGSGSHAANSLGYRAITDGNYYKIFYELGFIGLILMFFIMIPTILRAIRFFKYLYIELAITFFFTVACIGANPFSMPIIIAIYWFCVGRIWNKSYLDSLKDANIGIDSPIKTNKLEYLAEQS